MLSHGLNLCFLGVVADSIAAAASVIQYLAVLNVYLAPIILNPDFLRAHPRSLDS